MRSHGTGRLFPVLGHGPQNDLEVLLRIAERALPLQDRLFIKRLGPPNRGQIFQIDQILLEPLPVRLPPGILCLEFLIINNASRLGINKEHLPRLQTAFFLDPLGGNIQNACFGGHHDQTVFCQQITRRTKSVPVQNSPHIAAISKGDRGRTVPRLHQAGMVLIKGALLRIHVLITDPGLGDHHHDRMRQGTPSHDQKLESIIKRGRIAPVRADDRSDLLDIMTKKLIVHFLFTGPHPVQVPAQGVDLAVVRQHAVRMCQRPCGKGISAVA